MRRAQTENEFVRQWRDGRAGGLSLHEEYLLRCGFQAGVETERARVTTGSRTDLLREVAATTAEVTALAVEVGHRLVRRALGRPSGGAR
jgi:hypothetical protein